MPASERSAFRATLVRQSRTRRDDSDAAPRLNANQRTAVRSLVLQSLSPGCVSQTVDRLPAHPSPVDQRQQRRQCRLVWVPLYQCEDGLTPHRDIETSRLGGAQQEVRNTQTSLGPWLNLRRVGADKCSMRLPPIRRLRKVHHGLNSARPFRSQHFCTSEHPRRLVRPSLPVPVCPRSRLPICGRQLNLASLAYRSRVLVFQPAASLTFAFLIRFPSVPSHCVPFGFTATFILPRSRSWLFAPYDSRTSHTLFDRRSFDSTTTSPTPSFFHRALQVQRRQKQRKIPSPSNNKPATTSNTPATASASPGSQAAFPAALSITSTTPTKTQLNQQTPTQRHRAQRDLASRLLPARLRQSTF